MALARGPGRGTEGPAAHLSGQHSEDSISPAELRDRTLRGLRWIVIARPAGEVVLIGSMIVLARLISPAEFGRYAVAAIAGSVAVIPIAGVTVSLVQRKTLSHEHLQTGVALALILGLGLVAATFLAASVLVTPIYGARTADFVRLCAPLSLVVAAAAVPSALLQRRLAFRRLSVIELGGTLTRVVATVAMAVAGLNGVALVLGWLAGEAAELCLLWASAPPPSPRLRIGVARDLLSFGLPSSLAAASWFGFRNCDYAILGARLGPIPTGFYFRAYTLGVEYQKKVSRVMSTVGFPTLSRTRSNDEREALRASMVRLLSTVVFPLLVLLAVEAPVLVPWLFGSRWAPAAAPTQILAIGGASTLLIDAAGASLMASGRARALMGFGWGHFAAYAAAVFVVAPLGITAVAVAAAVVHGMFLLVAYRLLLRGSTRASLLTLWAEISPAMVACLVSLAAALPTSLALSASQIGTVAYLATVSLVGLAAYLVALRFLFPESLRRLGRLARQLAPRRPVRVVVPSAAAAEVR